MKYTYWQIVGMASAYLLFWGWNLMLLSVVGFGFSPVILFDLLIATAQGAVPLTFSLFGLAILGIPVLSCGVAIFTRLRTDPGRLLSLFYGVQIPVMLLLLVRFFAIHELVVANRLALAVVLFGGLGLLRTLFHGPSERSPSRQGLRLVSASGYLMVGLWWASLSTLLLFPIVLEIGWEVLRSPRYLLVTSFEDLGKLVVSLPFILFFLLTILMFAVMPFASLGVSARNWQLVQRESSARWGWKALLLSVFTWGTLAVSFGWLSIQPQRAVFTAVRQVESDADRAAIVADLERVRTGLLAARLGGDRYLEFEPDDPLVGVLLRPLIYDAVEGGSRWTRWGRRSVDQDLAESLYADVFDAPMAMAEREALLQSGTYTWSWEEAEAGLLEIGERKVRLAAQEVEVMPEGDVATVRVHDIWRNQTFARQEIRLSFELPESAAVTGLWLGHTEDRSEAFAYIVAPRGAAQEVYEREVQRRVDPALLEQVGPRQYRLRAFPVEPRESGEGSVWAIGEEGPPLHMWTEFVVPGVGDSFPMPRLTESRNAFWDARTERHVEGQPVSADGWTPELVGVAGAKAEHQVVLSGFQVRATPAVAGVLRRRAVDVIVDGSASMRGQEERIEAALKALEARLEVRVFCVREQVLGACDREWREGLFWGHASPAEHLAEWSALERSPDAVVVLTDAGSYSLMAGVEDTLPDVELPETWLVHFDGFPAAYPDWTLDRLQRSGGGVVGTVEELLSRMAAPDLVDGWRFSVEPVSSESGTPGRVLERSAFDAIAARAAIRALAATGEGEVEQLDALHRLAVEHHVVTAWSSMIVLVNDRQKEALKEASEDADRFEREATDGPEVSGVPEPATWLLLLLGGALVFGGRRGTTPRQ